MNAKEAILKRRSIRKFKSDLISEDLIKELIEAGYNAPSACNRKPYKIMVVTNEELLYKLDKCGRFTNMHSPLCIVVCGDMKKALPLGFGDYWVQDASAVTENILIMATYLGLGACWNGVYVQDKVVSKVKNILSLEDRYVPFSLIHIGYPLEEKTANSGYDEKKVMFFK